MSRRLRTPKNYHLHIYSLWLPFTFHGIHDALHSFNFMKSCYINIILLTLVLDLSRLGFTRVISEYSVTFRWGDAPRSMRYKTHSWWFPAAASIKGVLNSSSLASTVAPAAHSRTTTAKCPFSAAMCNGRRGTLSEFTSSTFACNSTHSKIQKKKYQRFKVAWMCHLRLWAAETHWESTRYRRRRVQNTFLLFYIYVLPMIFVLPPITFHWTGLLILDHSYIFGNLT